MATARPTPTGRESPFAENELIVTKTDLKGRITYANEVFLRISRLALDGALGQPHSLIRHPSMPRSVFRLLWQTIEAKGEFFGYVQNMATNGDHYWVFAHVTPSFDAAGNMVGFHSNRRRPDPAQIARIEPVYRRLLDEEARHGDRRQGLEAGFALFQSMLREKGVPYDQFAFSL
ncbi:MAG TPA: PAS domain-containing protein [Acetobacteraceae bacterium]|jgi:PAS domain S-box-containing protein|nr:PAS domain-containing protein [Acetobacteraceae bacterium]